MIINWKQKSIDGEQLGGKGKNLALLCNHGIPVPPWICVTASVFTSFIAPMRNELKEIFETLDYENNVVLKEASNKIQSLFDRESLDRDTALLIEDNLEMIGKDKFYAVRSSGNREDSMECSFAGLFETYLFVTPAEIPEYVKSCWLSLFTPSALSYLFKKGISPLDIEVAVVIQEMVHSEKSGVLFQADPAGKLEELVVVAGFGLGEGIVSDLVETDTCYHNKITGKRREILNHKESWIRFDPEKGRGIKKMPLPEDRREKGVLNDRDMDRLVKLHHSIEKIYNEYQDIEWAIAEDGTAYIMQSRPITTIPKGELHLYDYTNIIENYPGAIKPLTFGFVKNFFYKTHFMNFFRGSGFSERILQKNQDHFSGMVEQIQGRIYYNLTHWYKILSLFPSGAGDLELYLDEMLGVSGDRGERKKESDKSLFNRWKVSAKLALFFLFWKSYFNKINDFGTQICKESTKLIRAENSNEGLKTLFNKIVQRIFSDKRIGLIQANDLFLMISMGVLKGMVRKLDLKSENPDALLNGLLVGEEGMESVEPVLSIMKMVDIVRGTPDLVKVLEENPLLENLRNSSLEFKAFKKQFETHLELYGDRGIGELKMETVTFRHKPENLVKLVLNYVDSDVNPESMEMREAGLREEAEKELNQALKGYRWKGLVTRFMVEKVRQMLKNRESARLNRARVIGLFRELFLKIEANWIDQGVLDEEGDILYLNHQEVMDQIPNVDTPLIRERVGQRKKEWKEYESFEPVPRMWLKGSVKESFIPQVLKNNGIAVESELAGMGCCPGNITGEAVVLHSPDETVDVKGKILIAENTDPGWVFLIMGAKGLIIEKGSLLSHTAIIGRELGIPTIVGIKNATSKIPTGATVEMDGSTGDINILN